MNMSCHHSPDGLGVIALCRYKFSYTNSHELLLEESIKFNVQNSPIVNISFGKQIRNAGTTRRQSAYKMQWTFTLCVNWSYSYGSHNAVNAEQSGVWNCTTSRQVQKQYDTSCQTAVDQFSLIVIRFSFLYCHATDIIHKNLAKAIWMQCKKSPMSCHTESTCFAGGLITFVASRTLVHLIIPDFIDVYTVVCLISLVVH